MQYNTIRYNLISHNTIEDNTADFPFEFSFQWKRFYLSRTYTIQQHSLLLYRCTYVLTGLINCYHFFCRDHIAVTFIYCFWKKNDWQATGEKERVPFRTAMSYHVTWYDALSCHVMSPVVTRHSTALHNTAWYYTASYGSGSLSFSTSLRLKHTHR